MDERDQNEQASKGTQTYFSVLCAASTAMLWRSLMDSPKLVALCKSDCTGTKQVHTLEECKGSGVSLIWCRSDLSRGSVRSFD